MSVHTASESHVRSLFSHCCLSSVQLLKYVFSFLRNCFLRGAFSIFSHQPMAGSILITFRFFFLFFSTSCIQLHSTRESVKMCSFKTYNLTTCCNCLSLRTGCFIVTAIQLIELLLVNIAASEHRHPIVIVTNSVILIFIAVLLLGTIMRRPAQLRWWMVINKFVIALLSVVFSLCTFGFIFLFVQPAHQRNLEMTAKLVLCIYIGVAAVVVIIGQGIFAWIVHSYACQLREQNIGKPHHGRRPHQHHYVQIE